MNVPLFILYQIGSIDQGQLELQKKIWHKSNDSQVSDFRAIMALLFYIHIEYMCIYNQWDSCLHRSLVCLITKSRQSNSNSFPKYSDLTPRIFHWWLSLWIYKVNGHIWKIVPPESKRNYLNKKRLYWDVGPFWCLYFQKIIHHSLFITLLVGSKAKVVLVKKPSYMYVQTKKVWII